VKRLLAVALTAVPLSSVATPAAAGPPHRTFRTECVRCRRYCRRFTINSVMKNRTTASVNRILSASGSHSVRVMTSEGDVRTRVTAALDGVSRSLSLHCDDAGLAEKEE
jgi:hypothetical protein